MRRQRRGVDMGPRVDLHCHSVASDGLERAETLVERAATSGLSALAITDHDLPPVIPPGLHTVGTNEIRIIAGVELSTMHLGKELHLLVYFPDVMPPDFAAWCRARAKWRAEWFDTCAEALGLAVRADAEATAGRRTLTRLHLAREVVSSGLSRSLRDAFDEHVGHKSTVIPPLNLAFLDALAAAKAAGGWTSWAHPAPALADEWASGFAEAGLDALETHRPVKTGRNRLSALAARLGMGITGGSDWHGWEKRKMGSFRVPARTLHKTDKALGLLN